MRTRLISLVAAGGLAAGVLVAVNVVSTDEAAAEGLVRFDACSNVLDYFKEHARDDRYRGGDVIPLEQPEAATDGSARESAPSAPSPQEHSTTNVQEKGVDEPDVVKTDGKLMITALEQELQVMDVSGGSPVQLGKLALDDLSEPNLFLTGDQAVVLGTEFSDIVYEREPAPDRDRGIAPPQPSKTTSIVLLVDLSDPRNPQVSHRLELDGAYVDAREVDGVMRLVVSSSSQQVAPDDVPSSTIEDWLPRYRLDSGGQRTSGPLVGCDNIHHPPKFSGISSVSVLTFQLDEGLTDGDAVSVLTDGGDVYSSADRLYVTGTQWAQPRPMNTPENDTSTSPAVPVQSPVRTGIHAFDISGAAPAEYVASGEVEGTTIGQYAMSEHDGVLRVATTRDTGQVDATESQLVTFAERDGALVRQGAVGGLGKGERIYAVRYFGDVAYVVTYRQVDPLYVLDLSDPSSPTVEGELKITGYSSYLHDVGSGHLVGVGQEATTDGVTVGAQVSLFDVGNPSDPSKLDGYVLPEAYSEVERDPHAFLYWSSTGQLVVPMTRAEGSGAVVLQVQPHALVEEGFVEYAGDGTSGYAAVLRSVVVGDSLYTVWPDGVQANALNGLALKAWLSLT